MIIGQTKKRDKVQSVLRKIKNKFTTQEYHHFYLAGSCPGNFYGTAKINKLKSKDKVVKFLI